MRVCGELEVSVLLLVGMPGAGKGVFSELAVENGYSVVSMGDVVRDYVLSQGTSLSDGSVGRIAGEERKQHGMDIWARRTLESIRSEKTVIEGVRNWEEVELFRKNLGTVLIVALHSSPQARYARILSRGRADDAITLEGCKTRDWRELGWGLGNLIAMADHMIINDGTLDEFTKKVRDFLSGL